MKDKLTKLEMALIEKTSQHEKDLILYESKIKFIEQQRDNLKKEQIESNKRFENLLETIQKKGNAEKATGIGHIYLGSTVLHYDLTCCLTCKYTHIFTL